MSIQIPPLMTGTVTSQDGDRYRVNVMLDGPYSGQQPAQPVCVGTLGPRDAVRGHYPELPTPGTRGLIAFPRNDARNGIWLFSIEASENDSNAGKPGMTNHSYRAAWSGYWDYHGEDGTSAQQWPDGTSLIVGASGTVFAASSGQTSGQINPILTRNVVNTQQQRVKSQFTFNERVNNKPSSSFPVQLNHVTGTQVIIDTSGNVTVSGVGLVNVVAPNINLHATNETLLQVVLAPVWTWLKTHVHTGVKQGGDSSGPPVGADNVKHPLSNATLIGSR